MPESKQETLESSESCPNGNDRTIAQALSRIAGYCKHFSWLGYATFIGLAVFEIALIDFRDQFWAVRIWYISVHTAVAIIGALLIAWIVSLLLRRSVYPLIGFALFVFSIYGLGKMCFVIIATR